MYVTVSKQIKTIHKYDYTRGIFNNHIKKPTHIIGLWVP